MPDKTSIGISEPLRQYIEVLVEEVVLEGRPFDDEKKECLRRYSESEVLSRETLESNLNEFFQAIKELEEHESSFIERSARALAKECYLSEDLVNRLLGNAAAVRAHKEKDGKIEDEAYLKCTTIAACDNYLKAYPKGRYVQVVRNKKTQLEQVDAVRKAQEEKERKEREETERKARHEAERKAREEALWQKKIEEANKARVEAERMALSEKRAREETERKAQEERERRAKDEEEQRSRERERKEAEQRQNERLEIERRIREEAERRAREEAERKAKEEEERLRRERERREAERKASEERERKAKEEAIIRARMDAGDPSNYVFAEGGSLYMRGEGFTEAQFPTHLTQVSSFHIGKYVVTQQQWKSIMGFYSAKGSIYENCLGDRLPAVVKWDDLQEFIQKLSRLKGIRFQLPYEWEWDYAAIGGIYTRNYKYCGSNNYDEVAWRSGEIPVRLKEIGQKKSNELGLYDMCGNVEEWCVAVGQVPNGVFYGVLKGGPGYDSPDNSCGIECNGDGFKSIWARQFASHDETMASFRLCYY